MLMRYMNNVYIALTCLIFFVYATYVAGKVFLRVVKRMKWLFISIFIIYAYGTLGEYLTQMPYSLAPTIEGCFSG